MSLLLLDDQGRVSPVIDDDPLRTFPRYGMSISGLILNPRHNLKEIIARYRGCGVNLTRVNFLATSWVNPANVMPFRQRTDGRWDLFDWREEYFDRVQMVAEDLNAAGILGIGTIWELYSLSIRKHHPLLHLSPWRHNVNGIAWGVPVGDQTAEKADAIMLAKTMPGEWGAAFLEKLVPRWRPHVNIFEIGNEFPEKSLHERTRDVIRSIFPKALIQVNRNEDTPGQWVNMEFDEPNSGYDFLAHHGNRLKTLADLDRAYSGNVNFPNFRTLVENEDIKTRWKVQPGRLCYSSDGARVSDDPVNTYDFPKLRELMRYFKTHGWNLEHQSRAKMTDEPNHHMIETDWFESVIA